MQRNYVNFEQAKLLKELGFNEPCFFCFSLMENLNKNSDPCHLPEELNNYGCEGGMSLSDWLQDYNNKYYHTLSRPTQAQVVEWLWTKYSIWICVDYDEDDDEDYFTYSIRSKFGNYVDDIFKSSQEAYSAAFDRILILLKPL
jgi:hypothetical protein